MPGKASQVDVEMVRDAAAQLGLGGGGGPDLSAEVAALEADVAALQAADIPMQSDIATLQNDVSDLQGIGAEARLVALEDRLGNIGDDQLVTAWVAFDGSGVPNQLAGRGVADVVKNSPGNFTVFLGTDMGTTAYGVQATGSEPVRVVGRTSNTVDIDTGGVDPDYVTVSILGVPLEGD